MLDKYQKKSQKQTYLKRAKCKLYTVVKLNVDNSEDIAVLIKPMILN